MGRGREGVEEEKEQPSGPVSVENISQGGGGVSWNANCNALHRSADYGLDLDFLAKPFKSKSKNNMKMT